MQQVGIFSPILQTKWNKQNIVKVGLLAFLQQRSPDKSCIPIFYIVIISFFRPIGNFMSIIIKRVVTKFSRTLDLKCLFLELPYRCFWSIYGSYVIYCVPITTQRLIRVCPEIVKGATCFVFHSTWKLSYQPWVCLSVFGCIACKPSWIPISTRTQTLQSTWTVHD